MYAATEIRRLGLEKLACMKKHAVKVPLSLIKYLSAGGKVARVGQTGELVSIPGYQQYLSPAQFKRLARQTKSIMQEQRLSGLPIDQIQASRDMRLQRAAAYSRRAVSGRSRNLSALDGNGFTRAGTTYSGYDIYYMPYSEDARQALRKVIDLQYGMGKNPWCIIQRERGMPGMTPGSKYHWNEMGSTSSGKFRVAVDRDNGKIVAIENPDVGSAAAPSWQSLSNHSFVNIRDAARAGGAEGYGSFKHRIMTGHYTGADGKLYPQFNPGKRMAGPRYPTDVWRQGDMLMPEAADAVEVL